MFTDNTDGIELQNRNEKINDKHQSPEQQLSDQVRCTYIFEFAGEYSSDVFIIAIFIGDK
jgi:hypothetical protein